MRAPGLHLWEAGAAKQAGRQAGARGPWCAGAAAEAEGRQSSLQPCPKWPRTHGSQRWLHLHPSHICGHLCQDWGWAGGPSGPVETLLGTELCPQMHLVKPHATVEAKDLKTAIKATLRRS